MFRGADLEECVVAARHPCGQGYGIAVSTHIRRMALTHPRGPHCISIYDLDVIMSGTNLFWPPVSTHIPPVVLA